MVGSVNFIMYIPLLIMAYLELSQTGKSILDRNPNATLVSLFKNQINQGV